MAIPGRLECLNEKPCRCTNKLNEQPDHPGIRDIDRFHKKDRGACNICFICFTLLKTKGLELTLNIPSVDVLVRQSIEGSASAYRQIYERYARAMYNTALRITGNSADAEDILQESFIDAYLQLRTFESRATFGAWLKQIVVYKSIGLLKRRRVRFVELEPEADAVVENDHIEEPDNGFTVAAIKKSIAALPDGYRAVLSLYLLEGYDHEEIAGILNVSHSTVRTQYKRGKQKLLIMLKSEVNHE